MAAIKMLSWNIQVLGPNKYGVSPNNVTLFSLIGRLVASQNANVVVVMELMSSVSEQIGYSTCEAIYNATGQPWAYKVLAARPEGDREAYAICWQTNAGFAVVNDAAGNPNIALSTLQFPSNWSASYGRRAALATFRTTDTNTNFTVAVYHAPPNAQAILGLEALAKSPGLYSVQNGAAVQPVTARLLGGDYNLDVQVQPEYTWLTDPVPVPPPPAAAGQGAGCTAATSAYTHLAALADAIKAWGTNPSTWSNDPTDYRSMQLDNIFTTNPTGSGVVDLVAIVMDPTSGVRQLAQTFALTNGATQGPAFPNAWSIATPLNVSLTYACYAWMLIRYGISDHLPVWASATI